MRTIIASLTILVAFGCGSGEEAGSAPTDGFTVSGTISNAGTIPVYLEEVVGSQVTSVDTATLAQDGSFTLHGNSDEEGIYTIRVNNNRNVLLVLSNGSSVTISGNAQNMAAYTCSGDSKSLALKKFSDQVTQMRSAASAIPQQYTQAANQPGVDPVALRVEYEQRYSKALEGMNNYVKAFIDTAPLVSGIFSASLLDPNAEYEYLKNYTDRLRKEAPGSKYAQPLFAQIGAIAKTAIGAEAPEISLPTPDGDVRSLSALRGNVVLVDFWAAWCRPCRMENPNLVRAYKRFNPKGFQIYSVSLDQQKAAWVQAIKDDKLDWADHVSELVPQRWKDKVMQTYNFNSIPSSYLLDEDGNILAKNLRGEALVNKLAEIYGES